jgi:hypothetical protein
MFLRHYKLAISRIIMAVMVFASLAPTVSHALVSLTGNQSFTQKICTSNGSKVVIQVKTTMGKQLATELTLNPVNSAKPQTAENHFEHCPFCLNHTTAALPITGNAPLVITDEGRFFLQAHYLAPVLTALHSSDHPSRAPPLQII